MIRAAIVFCFLGLLSVLLGLGEVGGISMALGRILLGIFLLLAIVSVVSNVFIGRRL